MPTDPKFRVVAKRAGRPTVEVLAVFTAMLTNASANEEERGTLRSWSHEDIAVALDMEPEHAEAIYNAMQGKLLDGDKLTGWERRQPKRERDDNSAERVKAHRARMNGKETPDNADERAVTPRNASVTPRNALEERREEEIRKESLSAVALSAEPIASKPKGTRLSPEWKLPDDWRQWTRLSFAHATDAMVSAEADQFRDFWISKAGKEAAKLDWQATWRNWCRNSKNLSGLPRASRPINTGRMAWDEHKAKLAYLPTPRTRDLSPEERERIALEMEHIN